MKGLDYDLKRVYWETTAGCNLRCIHCRRTDALTGPSPEELTTTEGKSLIDQLTVFGRPVLILSGGEPLFRKDIFEIASYAVDKGLPVALSTNGTLVDERTAQKIKDCGIYYASVSLDGAASGTHDHFRGPGNFARTLNGFFNLKHVGIKTQINFTVTRKNVEELPHIYQMARTLGASALYLFLLVPVGCGLQIAPSEMLRPEEVEEWLRWVCKIETASSKVYAKHGESLPVKAICAPHYFRVASENSEIHNLPVRQAGSHPSSGYYTEQSEISSRKGCLAGIHMCFISHTGDVFPCGYLPLSCGNIRRAPLHHIWEKSLMFNRLRDPDLLEGRCGKCAFKILCGGCRARGYFASQNVLAEEPYCVFEPSHV